MKTKNKKAKAEIRNVRAPLTYNEMIVKLAYLEHTQGLFDLNYVHLYVKEEHPLIISLLKGEGIDSDQITASMCRTAKAMHRETWRKELLDWNADATKHLKVVLVGDMELDPAIKIENNPASESGQPYPEMAEKEAPDMMETPKQAIPEGVKEVQEMREAMKSHCGPYTVTPRPGMEKAAKKLLAPEVLKDTTSTLKMRLDKIRKEPGVEKALNKMVENCKPIKKKAVKGEKLLGFSVSQVLRWVADKFKKLDQEVIEKKATKLLKHFDLKPEVNTLKCQVRAGRLGKSHYGPLPKIPKEIASAILKILGSS